MNSSAEKNCAKCGKARSKVASITQWISYGDKCSCESAEPDPNSSNSEKNDIQIQRSESCARCGGALSKKSGSLTQWVFRSSPCKCVNTPSGGDATSQEGTTGNGAPFEENRELNIEPEIFPMERYIPLELIGAGQQGDVYRAKDRLLGRLVCIKVLKTERLVPKIVVRFQREAQAGGKLTHPTITTVLDFGMTQQGQPFLVMEFCSGKPLSDILKVRGALPLDLTLTLFEQICEGMQHAHQNRVLHRDLKPSNILISNIDTDEPTVKIIDFGLSGLLDTDDTGKITQGGLQLGTPAYMSPEQVQQGALDERADIYSVGCMLFETLTGKQVFEGETALAVMNMQIEADPPALSEAVPGNDYPQEMEVIVQRALEKNPDDRFQSMEDLKRELQNLQAAPTNTEVASAQVDKHVFDLSRFAPLALALLSLSVLAISAAVILSQSAKEETPTPKRDKYETVRWLTKEWTFASGDFHGGQNSRKLIKNCSGAFGLKVNDLNFSDNDVPVLVEMNPKALDLSGCGITDAGLKTLTQIKTLECLILNENKNISDSSIEIIKTFPNLKVIAIKGTQVTDAGVRKLAQMPTLGSIDISNLKNVSRESLISLSQLPHLYALRIDGTHIRGSDLELLKNLRSLSALSVEDLDLIDSDMPVLAALDLISIDVSNNPGITFAGVQVLKPSIYFTLGCNQCGLSKENMSAVEKSRETQPYSADALDFAKSYDENQIPEGIDVHLHALWYNTTLTDEAFIKELYDTMGRKPKWI